MAFTLTVWSCRPRSQSVGLHDQLFLLRLARRPARDSRRAPCRRETGGLSVIMTSMTTVIRHLTMAQLEAGLEEVLESPRSAGELKMIVRRPDAGIREELETG